MIGCRYTGIIQSHETMRDNDKIGDLQMPPCEIRYVPVGRCRYNGAVGHGHNDPMFDLWVGSRNRDPNLDLHSHSQERIFNRYWYYRYVKETPEPFMYRIFNGFSSCYLIG